MHTQKFLIMKDPNCALRPNIKSFLSLKILSNIADIMYIDVDINDGIDIINISDNSIKYLGNMVHDSMGSIFYEQSGVIYQHSNSLKESISSLKSLSCLVTELKLRRPAT